MAARLAEQLAETEFEFLATQINGDFALLIWRGTSSKGGATDGVDSFVIKGGLIRLQTG